MTKSGRKGENMPHPYKKDYFKQSLLVKQFLDVKNIQGGMCEHHISQGVGTLFLDFSYKVLRKNIFEKKGGKR